MSWDEAVYTVNQLKDYQATEQITGIPPQDPKVFDLFPSFNDSGVISKIKISIITPPPTIINQMRICTTKGVIIVKKEGSKPRNERDGVFISDIPFSYNKQEIIDESTFTEDTEYYYAAFPYSDHGVYNYSDMCIRHINSSKQQLWGFKQNFSDLNPETSISYDIPGVLNHDYTPMNVLIDNGEITYGGWEDFFKNELKNFPAMVHWDGTLDYWLDPNDYTKKLEDGTPSDYNNLNYEGGMFAWINKFYIKEVYSDDGESRTVYFSRYKYDDEFIPVGFIDREENEMDGIWIPMLYMSNSGKCVETSTPYYRLNQSFDPFSFLFDTINQRAAFYSGSINYLLVNLLIMFGKNVDIKQRFGYGWLTSDGYPSDYDTYDNRFSNKNFHLSIIPGFSAGPFNSRRMGKIFHSIPLGSYLSAIKDPSFIMETSFLTSYRNPNYLTKYDVSNISILKNTWVKVSEYIFGGHSKVFSRKLKPIPIIEDGTSINKNKQYMYKSVVDRSNNEGSILVGLCCSSSNDSNNLTDNITSSMFGLAISQKEGGAFFDIRIDPASNSKKFYTYIPVILPEPGYKPEFPTI